jgi:hypothetical protein
MKTTTKPDSNTLELTMNTPTTQAAGLSQFIPEPYYGPDTQVDDDCEGAWTRAQVVEAIRAALAARPTQAADPTPDQLRQMVREARNSSGNASDDCGPVAYVLHGWRAALAAQAVPAVDVEKHMCGYARLGSDGVYKLVGMRRNPIMDDGELHLILAFTDDQIEAFASPAPAEAKPCEGANCGSTDGLTHSPECIAETAKSQGWAEAREEPGPVPRPISDFPDLQREIAEKLASGELRVGGATPQPQAAFGEIHQDAQGVRSLRTETAQKLYSVPAGTKLYTAAPALTEEQTQGARDVLAERQRQISAEGWTPEHDDEHGGGHIANAAAAYAHYAAGGGYKRARELWPWSDNYWKPGDWANLTDRRRCLVKAGALILAEIERMDRRAAAMPEGGQG